MRELNSSNGGEKVVNEMMLRETIKERGCTITFLARKLGISREGFYKKLSGKSEYKASEIFEMQKVLNLTDEKRDQIFFAENSELNSR